MTQQGLNAYRRTEVQSRTPLELVVMLYDGALRFAALAHDATLRQDLPARRDATSRLLAIIGELQNTLDLVNGGEVATALDGLYGYMSHRVLEATAGNTPVPLEEVSRLLTTLRDGWLTVANTGGIDPVVAASAMAPATALLEQAR
jgi:flagellar protein FliS